MTDMIVSGAGTTAVNGTYIENGTFNDKPKYTFDDYEIRWRITTRPPVTRWELILTSEVIYYSNDNVATPDLCTTWQVYEGNAPAPTVTAAGGGDQSGALRRTNMNAQMSNLTGGMHG